MGERTEMGTGTLFVLGKITFPAGDFYPVFDKTLFKYELIVMSPVLNLNEMLLFPFCALTDAVSDFCQSQGAFTVLPTRHLKNTTPSFVLILCLP